MDPSSSPPPPYAPSRTRVAALIAAAVAAVALPVLVAFAPSGDVSTFEMRRVTMEQVLAAAPAESVAQGCPQLTNPGGRIDWTPVANPGPVPTNGRIQLPSIGIDAPIVRVGMDASERMVVPTNARDVAWLDQGGIPGRTQNVVLAGHIAYNRIAGSFNRIKDLRPGDEIIVAIESRQLRYRVVFNCSFPRDTTLAERIMGYTRAPSLTLISCGGVFDTAARTHTDRIAVRAELIDESGDRPAPAISTA
jgi:LPXTG-site transpeptidase (sortase) family protein